MNRGRCRLRALLAAALIALLCPVGAFTPVQAAERAGTGRTAAFRSGGARKMNPEQPRPEDRHAVLSQGVKNLVKRSRQLTEIVWTPVCDLEGWRDKEEHRFYAGVPYTGIPYGQPHRSGSYVPWQTDLNEFLRQIADPTGPMYTERAVSQIKQNPSPYYSCECSAFVSWAWDLKSRETTHTLGHYGTLIGKRMTDLQVGDCLLEEGKHARLVTDMTFDAENNISGIEIAEERAPGAYRMWYLADSSLHPLSELQTEYLDKGYIILRCNHRDSVGYTHSCAVPLPGDVCPVCGVNPFTDLQLDRWYSSAAAFVCNQGIMAGTGKDSFSPDLKMNRAMFVTVLWRMYHSPAADALPPFRDIKTGAYYYEALRWAWSNGFAAGTGNGNFSPDDVCSRAQIVTFLWVAAGRPKPVRGNVPFTDVKPNTYYYDAVRWAVGQGIVSGKTATCFDPNAPATRAEAAVMIWRACECQCLYR